MKVKCPNCGALIAGSWSGAKPFCRNCGWNVAAAANSARISIRGSLGAGCFGILLSALAWWHGPYGFSGAAMLGAAFILFPGTLAVASHSRLRTILRAGESTVSGPARVTVEDRDYMNAAVPRRVYLTWRGWLYSVGVAAALAILLFFGTRLLQSGAASLQAHVAGTVAFVFFMGLCLIFFRNRIREWRLLNEGVIARGRVLEQFEMGRNLPRITYGFRDAMGREFQNRATDFSHGLYEQMPVTVFHEPANPANSVVLESSLFKIC